MRRSTPILASLVLPLGLLIGCTGLRVQTDYDEAFDFSGRGSYAWLEPPVVETPLGGAEAPDPFARNSLLDQRVRHAVDRALEAKGYRRSDEDPAFRLQYYVVLRDRTKIRPTAGWGGYYGRSYGGYYGVGGVTSYDYQEGTLLIDIIDARTGRLAWRGWSVGANRDGYFSGEKIDESVDKILSEFPPGRAQ